MRRRRAIVLGAVVITSAALGAALLPKVASAAKTGKVTGTITLKSKSGDAVKDRKNVVVYLKGVPGALPDQSKKVHKIRQKDKQFDPRISVVLKGSTLEFPNDDKIDHNVFSLSKTARFDLGLYRSGTSKSVKTKRTGVIDVYCNIHPQMSAKVVVLDTKYHFVTGKSGKFRIDKVPAGKYKLVAWEARSKEYRAEVTIPAGGSAKHDFTLVRTKRQKRHRRKDGSPYGRYK